MFKEDITSAAMHDHHKDVYEHTGVVVDLNNLQEISNTPESKEKLNSFLLSCKDYFKAIDKLDSYIKNSPDDIDYDNKSIELAESQSDFHDIVVLKLEDFIQELELENKDTAWAEKIRGNRREIGRFAALVGEGE